MRTFDLLKYLVETTIGRRAPAPNPHGDYVVLRTWRSHNIPTDHIAIEAIKNSNEKHYLSFSPSDPNNLENRRTLVELREGVEAHFRKNLKDEYLLQGFRNKWIDEIRCKRDPQQLFKADGQCETDEQRINANEQRRLVGGQDLKYIGACTILEVAKLFDPATQDEMRKLGVEKEKITLRSLNVDEVIKKINDFKSHPSSWAFFAGTSSHEENTYNCASMALLVLQAGGLNKLVIPYNDLFGLVVGIAAIGYLAGFNQSWMEKLIQFAMALIAIAMARGLGGAYEGIKEIQVFLNVVSLQKEDTLATVLGLRLLSLLVCGAAGVVMSGPIYTQGFALPGNVTELAQQAECTENTCIDFKEPEISAYIKRNRLE